jgi:hypothetical protein
VHTPFEHSWDSTPAPEHGRLQRPQEKTSVATLVSHPGAFVQSAKPPPQMKPQMPDLHCGVPWSTDGQTLPHELQLFGSVCVSTHCPLQAVSGGEQVLTHCPDWQTLPPPHGEKQLPQCALLLCVSTH